MPRDSESEAGLKAAGSHSCMRHVGRAGLAGCTALLVCSVDCALVQDAYSRNVIRCGTLALGCTSSGLTNSAEYSAELVACFQVNRTPARSVGRGSKDINAPQQFKPCTSAGHSYAGWHLQQQLYPAQPAASSLQHRLSQDNAPQRQQQIAAPLFQICASHNGTANTAACPPYSQLSKNHGVVAAASADSTLSMCTGPLHSR